MSDPRDNELRTLARPRPDSFDGLEVMPPDGANQLAPRQVQDLFGAVTTAMPVVVRRNVPEVMKRLAVMAQTFGDKYLYGWEVKKKGGGTDWIEGGTVDLAYDLAREYGNNATQVRAIDTGAHIMFYARFTDLETGYTTERAFQQRKNQNTGMKDVDRQSDIVFQIGQSKAIRNVTLKALSSFAEFCMDEAKRSVYGKIEKDPAKYLAHVERGMASYEIPLKDVERSIGRAKAAWLVRDIATVFTKLKAIADGMVSATDAFPPNTPDVVQDPQPDETSASSGAGAAGAGAPVAAPPGTGRRQAPPPGGASEEGEDAPPAKAAAKPKAVAPQEPEAEQAPQAEPAAAARKPAAKPKALFDEAG